MSWEASLKSGVRHKFWSAVIITDDRFHPSVHPYWGSHCKDTTLKGTFSVLLIQRWAFTPEKTSCPPSPCFLVETVSINIYSQKYPIYWCKSYGYELRLGYAWLRLKGQNQAIFIRVRLQNGGWDCGKCPTRKRACRRNRNRNFHWNLLGRACERVRVHYISNN